MPIRVDTNIRPTAGLPIDERLLYTASVVLFRSASTDIIPASQRYLGMEVYIPPHTCSYTLISGEARTGGGINQAVWCTGSATASFALNSRSSSYSTTTSYYQYYDVTIYHESNSFASSSTWAQYTTQSIYATNSVYARSASWASSSLTANFTPTALSASFASSSLTSSHAPTASILINRFGELYFISASAPAITTTSIISINTASFKGCFLNYISSAGINLRAGQITSAWSGSGTIYSEIQTTDLGDTSLLNWNIVLNGNNAVFQVENASVFLYQIKANMVSM